MNPVQVYLDEKLNRRYDIEVLYPAGDAPAVPINPPSCDLGVALVEIFKRWPSAN